MAVGLVLEVPQNIALALGLASTATGADYNYLLHTAYRESKFESHARARTSSAVGLFQFIEETWLRTLKSEGGKFGLGDYSRRIFKTRSGRHYVPDAAARQEILALRRDPRIASLMAGVFARNNADRLASEIGRKPTAGELYLAHFLGVSDAIRLIKLVRSYPNRKAAREFPAAAKANRRIFYKGKQARTARQVYLNLVRPHNRAAKARVHIRQLVKNNVAKKTGRFTKRSLRGRASVHALKAGMAVPSLKQKKSAKSPQWSTLVRPGVEIAAMLRGSIDDGAMVHLRGKQVVRGGRN